MPVQINNQDMTITIFQFVMYQDISGECTHRETGKIRLQWAAAASGYCGLYQEQGHSMLSHHISFKCYNILQKVQY